MSMKFAKPVMGAAALSAAFVMLMEPAFAADADKGMSAAEIKYIFNTFSFLVCGFLVMWMAAGFAMLEAGLVRTKNVAMQLTKNIALYAMPD